VPEDAPLSPRSIYAATKVNQEHLVDLFGRGAGAPVISLRYHNVYGPRLPRDTPYAGVASIFCSALAAGRSPAVFEDGRQRCDFVHVRDVARANRLALTAPGSITGSFNVATGEIRTIGEMAATLADSFPAAPRPRVTGEWRLGDVRHVFASTRRASEVLRFVPMESFAAGMAELGGVVTRT
jgi:dTDP-L-rhamnose 4-epimerase